MKPLLLPILILIGNFALAQEKKIEKEEDIERKELPLHSQQYLQENIPQDAKKLRFYFETDGDKESYEAKFKFRKNRYSVEFDATGQLEDIEIVVKKDFLDKDLRTRIEKHLDNQNERFKIEKIQAQYLSEGPNTKELLPGGKNKKLTPDNYELIVATKNKGKLKKYEMLFDANGNFINEREILRNSYDYLIF